MTIPQILENPRKSNRDGVFFRIVTGLVVLLKQEPTTAVFVKTYFLYNTSLDRCF